MNPGEFDDSGWLRAYRLLLRLYPLAFRRRHEAAMLDSLRDRLADPRYAGTGRLRLLGLMVEDLVRSVIQQRAGASSVPARGSRSTGWRADLGFGVRMLYRDPATTLLSTAALGLGIGLSTVAFAVLYGTVLRGLPFERADELVHFERANRVEGFDSLAVTPHDFVAWRDNQTSFVGLAAYVEALFLFDDEDGYTRSHWGIAISADAFDLLGVEPVVGRVFNAQEDAPDGPEVVLIGHEVWRTRFGADPEVVGSSIQLNGVATTVLGVMPADFGFPVTEQFWRPLQLDLAEHQRGRGRLDVFGRLRPGVGIAQARADFTAITRGLQEQYPETNTDIEASLKSFTEEYVGPEFTARVWTMLVAAVLVLALSCLNVSSLLLARASARAGEVAVRAALGASRARIARQLLVETGLLAVLGGFLGIALASVGLWMFATYWAGTTVFALPHGPEAPAWWRFRIDRAALVYSGAVTLAAAGLAGIAPLLHLRGDLHGVLKDQRAATPGRARARWGSALVVAEMALCTTLLVCAGLVIRSYGELSVVGDGLQLDRVHSVVLSLPRATVFDGSPGAVPTEHTYADRGRRLELWRQIDAGLGREPMLAGHALATALPASGSARMQFMVPTDEVDAELPRTRYALVSPGMFELLGVAPLTGRLFDARDDVAAEPVVLVNATFATTFFGDGSALNRMVRMGDADSSAPWARVVGVVPDLWMDGVRNREPWGLYVPLGQAEMVPAAASLGSRHVLLRPGGAVRLAESAVRRVAADLDDGVPVSAIESLAATVQASTGRYRVHGSFYLFLGAVAMLLAAVGLYGVLSRMVAGRTPEIGTRMALGADSASVVRLVLAGVLRQVLLGAALGLLFAAWLQPQLEQILYQVAPWDPEALAVLVLALIGIAAVSSFVPARRAARVDPLRAMRAD